MVMTVRVCAAAMVKAVVVAVVVVAGVAVMVHARPPSRDPPCRQHDQNIYGV